MQTDSILFSPESVPPSAAPLEIDYPQFREVPVPQASGATRAWEGYIRPFMDDQSAKNYLRIVEADGTIQLSEGTITVGDASHLPEHWAEPLLIRMNRLCKVLVLEMPEPVHPRAYLLEPLYSSSTLSFHPHPRGDISITIASRRVAGLCIYSAAEFEYSTTDEKLVQFLDLVTTHVARHLIWLKTRRFFEFKRGAWQVIYTPRPGELIVDNEVGVRDAVIASRRIRPLRRWDGYWPGRSARYTGARSHTANIKPTWKCWCGSGQEYGQCCRPFELKLL